MAVGLVGEALSGDDRPTDGDVDVEGLRLRLDGQALGLQGRLRLGADQCGVDRRGRASSSEGRTGSSPVVLPGRADGYWPAPAPPPPHPARTSAPTAGRCRTGSRGRACAPDPGPCRHDLDGGAEVHRLTTDLLTPGAFSAVVARHPRRSVAAVAAVATWGLADSVSALAAAAAIAAVPVTGRRVLRCRRSAPAVNHMPFTHSSGGQAPLPPLPPLPPWPAAVDTLPPSPPLPPLVPQPDAPARPGLPPKPPLPGLASRSPRPRFTWTGQYSAVVPLPLTVA